MATTPRPLRPVKVWFHVPADPTQVFAFVSDTRNDPIWCPNVTDVVQVDGHGVHPGARFRFNQTVRAGGRDLVSEVDVEVIRVDDRTIEWQVEDRFQERHVRLSVSEDKGGSVVSQTTVAAFKRPPGLAGWFYPLLARRTFKDQFTRLAEHFAE